MLVELSYLLFGILLIVYAAWMFFRRKERHILFLTLGFTFLELSILLQILNLTWWVHIYQFNIDPRFLELGGLAFFAIFIVTAILALKETKVRKIDS
jgi:hypothetical protein